jgi:hypothetical protein
MASVMVRVEAELRDLLRVISKETGKPAGEILEEALELYRRRRFLEEANRSFAALRRDPKRWKEELAERRAWESTLMDGQHR